MAQLATGTETSIPMAFVFIRVEKIPRLLYPFLSLSLPGFILGNSQAASRWS